MGGNLSRLVYLAPRQGFGLNSVISSFLLHHNLGIFRCKRCEHYFSQTEMFTSNISLVTLVRGVGAKLSRLVYLAPRQGFGSNSVISSFLLYHNLGIFSCKRYKHYFSQTEMFTSNVQFGYPCLRGGGGKLSRLVYLAPRQGFGSNSVISSFLLYHNLGIFSCKRYKHYFSQTEMFTSNVQFGYPCLRGGGGKLSRLVYLAPRQGFGSNSVISSFLLHHNLGIFSCKRYKHYFSQTEMFTSNVQFGYPCLRGGGGQAVQAGLSCPPPRIWVEQCHQFILIAP